MLASIERGDRVGARGASGAWPQAIISNGRSPISSCRRRRRPRQRRRGCVRAASARRRANDGLSAAPDRAQPAQRPDDARGAEVQAGDAARRGRRRGRGRAGARATACRARTRRRSRRTMRAMVARTRGLVPGDGAQRFVAGGVVQHRVLVGGERVVMVRAARVQPRSRGASSVASCKPLSPPSGARPLTSPDDSPAAAPTADEAMQQAIACHRRGELDAAEAIYARLLRREPRRPDALNFMGMLQFQRGDRERALELLQRASLARAARGRRLEQPGQRADGAGPIDRGRQGVPPQPRAGARAPRR